MRERERGGANACVTYKMTNGWKNVAGAHSVCFLVDFSVYEFRSFVSLNGSKCSVFVQQSSYQLIVQWSYCGIKFWQEAKKEENNCDFRPRAVSNSGDPTVSVKHLNSFGSAQEYLVSIYISKTNPLVGNIRVNHVKYPMRRPFLNRPNPTYSTRYPCWIIPVSGLFQFSM